MATKLTMYDVNPKRRASKLDSVPVDELKTNRDTMSVAYMAHIYGVSKATMYRALRKAGLVNGKQS